MRDLGYEVATVTYDDVGKLRRLEQRQKIDYPMLSDVNSDIIRAFGLLAEEYPEGSFYYGVPRPAIIVLDAEGKVFAWGKGEDGTLGIGDRSTALKPRLLEGLLRQPIAQMTCRGAHVLALTERGATERAGGRHANAKPLADVQVHALRARARVAARAQRHARPTLRADGALARMEPLRLLKMLH